jgi:hypothetical protein
MTVLAFALAASVGVGVPPVVRLAVASAAIAGLVMVVSSLALQLALWLLSRRRN